MEKMEEQQVFDKVVEVLTPYARDKEALASVSLESDLLKGLQVNSSRLVDIVLDFEDKFDIEIADEEADQVTTVGAAVSLILAKQA
jgi:acyl carrier protein